MAMFFEEIQLNSFSNINPYSLKRMFFEVAFRLGVEWFDKFIKDDWPKSNSQFCIQLLLGRKLKKISIKE